jgi:hypothetical protein
VRNDRRRPTVTDVPHIPIPDNWNEMSDDDKDAFTEQALKQIAAATGLTGSSEPADGSETDATPGDTPRVFREPGTA